jgi:cholera toxin transcriptional activator
MRNASGIKHIAYEPHRSSSCIKASYGPLYIAFSTALGVLHQINWPQQMSDAAPQARYRFGVFEADVSTGELRKQGIRIKLNAQPFQVLLMLLERPGEVLTREEISQSLWSDGTFVDYEHGLNSAVNRIREALGDCAGNPRFVETLARRGYRFVAPVQRLPSTSTPAVTTETPQLLTNEDEAPKPLQETTDAFLPTPAELPDAPHSMVRILFLLLQLMYVGFYVGSLANLPEIEDLLSPLPAFSAILYILIGTAVILIAVRAYLVSAIGLCAPGMRGRFLKMWPYLLVSDVLWSLSPLLLLHHINSGIALACIALLVYAPFAQRSLILMGAARVESSQTR